MWKRKAKKTSNERIKQELLSLLQENDDVEEQGLNETANNVNNSQEAIIIICRYEDIKTHNKKAKGYIGKQGELLKKFKDTENFFDNVGQSRSRINFKISLYKFLKKYPLLKKSTLQSSYFKNNFKVVCKENPTSFESIIKIVLIFLRNICQPAILRIAIVFHFSFPQYFPPKLAIFS